jgi:dGTPase
MNWQMLYSARRTGDPIRKDANPDALRTSYIRDYDRLIFSSPFRRLQNKTQVFPLPGPVFVHNRLTHSLEVASVGRSLGKAAGELLADKYSNSGGAFREFYRYELASVVAAACLAHDIGNPPFGHSGEDAIRTYFKSLDGAGRTAFEDQLTPNQLRDFEAFEGNANAFRILTHSFNEPVPGGQKLTYATLASVIKYPCTSAAGFDKSTGLIATRKSGFFDSEQATYQAIAEALQIARQPGFENVYARHPFVFLVEAADDICYRVIDLEDAHRLGIVALRTIEDLFLPFFSDVVGYNSADYVRRKLGEINDDNQKVQFIRAKWIGLMVGRLTEVFIDKEAAMLAGTLNKSLLDCLPPHELELMKAIDAHSVKHVYGYSPVIEIEVAGYHVIGGLLREFAGAVLQPASAKARHVLRLIPAQFPIDARGGLYGNLQSVVDFVSGMTDLFAVDLYRKMTGISIPQLR